MSEIVRCPSCSMLAQRDDHRRWIPLLSELDDWRQCRNCGADVEVGALSLDRGRLR